MTQAKTAGELHLLTLDCPSKMRIVVPASDHSYRRALAHRGTAILHPNGSWSEDYGDLNPTEWGEDGSERVEVLIIE